MMYLLEQGASTVVQFGPFVDATDGVTLETGLATAMDNATTGIRVSKNGAVLADRNSSTAPSYDAMGLYRVTLDATDTSDLGPLRIIFEESATCLPGWMDFLVVSPTAYAAVTAGSSLSSGSASISTTASSATVTTGTETLTYTATSQLDGSLHEVADVGNSTEFYYEFSVGGNGIPTEFLWSGYASSNGDSYAVKAYNWAGTSWDQIATLDGSNGTTIIAETFQTTNAHVGTGSDIGKVRLQFSSSDGTHFATDRVLCSYAVVAQSVGYANGMFWLDTVDGVSGTEAHVNGIADNPALTLANILTMQSSIPLNDIHVSSSSTLAPAADLNDTNVFGVGYTLDLGGYDYAGTHVYHASPVNGIATTVGSSDHFDILDSIIDTMTSDDTHMTNCIFIGTYTFGTSGIVSPTVNINHCKSGIAGAAAPVFTKTSGATLTCSFRDWKGGVTINGLESGDTLTIGGNELGTITLNGADASVEIRGIAKAVTNNLTGSPTVNTDGVVIGSDVAGIKTTTDQITFTVANQVDSNAKSMNDAAITGAGTTADPWT